MTKILASCLLAATAHAQLTAAPSYTLQTLPTPAVVQGGVVRRGSALLVGQGDFGPGLASIVRLEAGRATTIATGFGGLGGFDLAEDGTLYVVDNCFTADFGCAASTTGDTVYAIPDALTRTTPIAAADAELLPSGSISFPYDVAMTPLGLLVSDAVGPGAGRVVRVEETGIIDVATGLDYAAGIAFGGSQSLFVANVAADFTGGVVEFPAGSPGGSLVDGLAGAAGLAVESGRDLLLGAGSTLLAIDDVGDTTERASGFAFAGDVAYEPERGAALVLDFGASAVTVVCADDEGDGVCDLDCVNDGGLERASLTLTRGRRPGEGSLRVKARLPVDLGLAADPSVDGMHVQVVDAAGLVVLDVALPGGSRWKAKKRNRAWTYRDATGALAVTDVTVTPDRRDDEIVKLAVRSRKQLTVDPATLALPLRVTLAFDSFVECGTRVFATCALERERAITCE
jgi:hypothetical protein